MICIGIDPGTHTGFAVWDARERKLVAVESMPIYRAIKRIESMVPERPLVIYEDARRIRVGGGHTYGQMARLQGVGSVKRDSAIWQEVLEELGLPHSARTHHRGTTKWNASQFASHTGWSRSTNEHARDAAVIVHGLNLPMAQGVVRAWEQSRSAKTRPSSTAPLSAAGIRSQRYSTRGAG